MRGRAGGDRDIIGLTFSGRLTRSLATGAMDTIANERVYRRGRQLESCARLGQTEVERVSLAPIYFISVTNIDTTCLRQHLCDLTPLTTVVKTVCVESNNLLNSWTIV